MTLDPLAALDAASKQFRRHLAVVADDEWTVAATCTDWDVHNLVAHVVGGNRFASLVLAGRRSGEAMQAVMGSPQLGDDPLGAFVEVLDEVPGMGFGIEPCGDVGPEATAMERLLDLCGRCDGAASA